MVEIKIRVRIGSGANGSVLWNTRCGNKEVVHKNWKHFEALGACRTLGIESEKAAERGQILTISPAHSGTMVQEIGEIWAA